MPPAPLPLDVVRGELAVHDGDVDQLAAGEALERGALVDRQVRAFLAALIGSPAD